MPSSFLSMSCGPGCNHRSHSSISASFVCNLTAYHLPRLKGGAHSPLRQVSGKQSTQEYALMSSGIFNSMRNQLLVVCGGGTACVLITGGVGLLVQWSAVQTLGAA